jgi:hypothetical protein
MIHKNFLFVYAVSDAIRNSLRGGKFRKFSGGTCPPDPPSLGTVPRARISPLYDKILY